MYVKTLTCFALLVQSIISVYEIRPTAIPIVMLLVSGIIIIVSTDGIVFAKSPKSTFSTESNIVIPTKISAGAVA